MRKEDSKRAESWISRNSDSPLSVFFFGKCIYICSNNRQNVHANTFVKLFCSFPGIIFPNLRKEDRAVGVRGWGVRTAQRDAPAFASSQKFRHLCCKWFKKRNKRLCLDIFHFNTQFQIHLLTAAFAFLSSKSSSATGGRRENLVWSKALSFCRNKKNVYWIQFFKFLFVLIYFFMFLDLNYFIPQLPHSSTRCKWLQICPNWEFRKYFFVFLLLFTFISEMSSRVRREECLRELLESLQLKKLPIRSGRSFPVMYKLLSTRGNELDPKSISSAAETGEILR